MPNLGIGRIGVVFEDIADDLEVDCLYTIATTIVDTLDLSTISTLSKVVLALAGIISCILCKLGACCDSVSQASAIDTSLGPTCFFQLEELIHGVVQRLQ